ncbi:MFS transporter [Burkholderia gladioli]|uniref:Major facilitator transporter n=1 Tax=Burkholderia gladioli (strain BSR3) TaxID=999541 RepID=F2LE14_BURGS|nr:MFS transporter [Burkholderia gladioli]AEA61568.1 major facilitator transporter [Burkholderia gladioli BSR3]MBW5283489.1 MFS transporter [Burkholderia gladioli]
MTITLNPLRERTLLWLLALTQFTVIMDFMVMMPLGPQIMHAFAITPAQFASAVSAYSLCSGLSGLFAATYIDRFDRRRMLQATYALFALSNLACALAGNFHLLLLARAFAGLTGGVLGAIVMAIVSDVIPVARRGAATGVIMTAFSMAAIGGVPAGVLLGAHFSWSAPFLLLVVLSVAIWLAGTRVVPSLAEHVGQPTPLSRILPQLFSLLSLPRHLKAFALTFVMMSGHMLVIPFISPMLVANHGVQPQQLSWLYMAGGAATLLTSRWIGRLSDRYGKRQMFRVTAVVSMLPVLLVTHLPAMPFVVLIAFFGFFMVAMSGRMVPMQALLTTVPEPARRGAFLSANSAVQALGMGIGAWVGGLLLANGPNGTIVGYGSNGWLAVIMTLITIVWVAHVKGSGHDTPMPAGPQPAAAVAES